LKLKELKNIGTIYKIMQISREFVDRKEE